MFNLHEIRVRPVRACLRAARKQARTQTGKTMRNAIDENGDQVHIMSVVGHDSKTCFACLRATHRQAQKK